MLQADMYLTPNGDAVELDVVLADGQTAEQAAEWLASGPSTKGRVTAEVVDHEGPAGGWPVIRVTALETDPDKRRKVLNSVVARYNGDGV